MPMKSAMQQIREDPQGREMLATTTLETPVQTVRATISFDDADPAELLIDANMLVLDAKVYVVTAFDAGTTNAIQFAIGSSTVLGGGLLLPFANAYDLNPGGLNTVGAAVTGFTGFADTPQFLPTAAPTGAAVFVTYTGTGTAATQGQAIVVLSYVPYA